MSKLGMFKSGTDVLILYSNSCKARQLLKSLWSYKSRHAHFRVCLSRLFILVKIYFGILGNKYMCNQLIELMKDVTIAKDGCVDLSFQKGHLLRVRHRSQTVILVQNECGVSFTLRLNKENKDWRYF